MFEDYTSFPASSPKFIDGFAVDTWKSLAAGYEYSQQS
jgi:hypothetical protein